MVVEEEEEGESVGGFVGCVVFASLVCVRVCMCVKEHKENIAQRQCMCVCVSFCMRELKLRDSKSTRVPS